jgi:hypothetical protein
MWIVAMGTTATKAQLIPLPEFTGSFTLPVRAQWDGTSLPAGHYSLYYGAPFGGGSQAVEVLNSAEGTVRMVLVRGITDPTAAKTELVCIREGNVDIVRALNVPALGESIHFSLPHNMNLMAYNQKHNSNTRVAALHGLTQFVPVTFSR